MEQMYIMGDILFNSMKVLDLKMMIRYQFKSNDYKDRGVKRPDLRLIAVQLYDD